MSGPGRSKMGVSPSVMEGFLKRCTDKSYAAKTFREFFDKMNLSADTYDWRLEGITYESHINHEVIAMGTLFHRVVTSGNLLALEGLLAVYQEKFPNQVKEYREMMTSPPERSMWGGEEYEKRVNRKYTALHLIAITPPRTSLENLIGIIDRCQINVNEEIDGLTPLHFAVEQRHLGAVRALIECKADLTREYEKRTPFSHLVESIGKKEPGEVTNVEEDKILGLLLEKGGGPPSVTQNFIHFLRKYMCINAAHWCEENLPFHHSSSASSYTEQDGDVEMAAGAAIEEKLSQSAPLQSHPFGFSGSMQAKDQHPASSSSSSSSSSSALPLPHGLPSSIPMEVKLTKPKPQKRKAEQQSDLVDDAKDSDGDGVKRKKSSHPQPKSKKRRLEDTVGDEKTGDGSSDDNDSEMAIETSSSAGGRKEKAPWALQACLRFYKEKDGTKIWYFHVPLKSNQDIARQIIKKLACANNDEYLHQLACPLDATEGYGHIQFLDKKGKFRPNSNLLFINLVCKIYDFDTASRLAKSKNQQEAWPRECTSTEEIQKIKASCARKVGDFKKNISQRCGALKKILPPFSEPKNLKSNKRYAANKNDLGSFKSICETYLHSYEVDGRTMYFFKNQKRSQRTTLQRLLTNLSTYQDGLGNYPYFASLFYTKCSKDDLNLHIKYVVDGVDRPEEFIKALCKLCKIDEKAIKKSEPPKETPKDTDFDYTKNQSAGALKKAHPNLPTPPCVGDDRAEASIKNKKIKKARKSASIQAKQKPSGPSSSSGASSDNDGDILMTPKPSSASHDVAMFESDSLGDEKKGDEDAKRVAPPSSAQAGDPEPILRGNPPRGKSLIGSSYSHMAALSGKLGGNKPPSWSGISPRVGPSQIPSPDPAPAVPGLPAGAFPPLPRQRS